MIQITVKHNKNSKIPTKFLTLWYQIKILSLKLNVLSLEITINKDSSLQETSLHFKYVFGRLSN